MMTEGERFFWEHFLHLSTMELIEGNSLNQYYSSKFEE